MFFLSLMSSFCILAITRYGFMVLKFHPNAAGRFSPPLMPAQKRQLYRAFFLPLIPALICLLIDPFQSHLFLWLPQRVEQLAIIINIAFLAFSLGAYIRMLTFLHKYKRASLG